MQSRKDRWQEDLFIASPLRDLVPEDHILKRVDRILDLSWLHDLVSGCYCQDNGRPSIDPESALRLMLAGFFEGIVQDRRLMRRAQTDLAFRWFAGYRPARDMCHCSGRADGRTEAGMVPCTKPMRATDGAWKACTAGQKPTTAYGAQPNAPCPTCAPKPTSPPPS